MTDYYITVQLKYKGLNEKDIEYLNIQIQNKISEWSLTLVNSILNNIDNEYISFIFDISLKDDADTIGACIEDIKRYISNYRTYKTVFTDE